VNAPKTQITPSDPARQSVASLERNVSFFRDNAAYSNNVGMLDTYRNIRTVLNAELRGIERLLDVGNGGTFDYDPAVAREVTAVDLFLEELSADAFPRNVRLKNGSALDLPEPDASFDGVLMSMLIHHLVGKSVSESLANTSRALAEAWRVLKPGGKLIISESCVPAWFYAFERAVFPLVTRVIGFFTDHPATLQFPAELIVDLAAKEVSADLVVSPIPRGRWILQFNVKFPTALTPAVPHLFIARK
jgi:SAM-dependent methyltransferase